MQIRKQLPAPPPAEPEYDPDKVAVFDAHWEQNGGMAGGFVVTWVEFRTLVNKYKELNEIIQAAVSVIDRQLMKDVDMERIRREIKLQDDIRKSIEAA